MTKLVELEKEARIKRNAIILKKANEAETLNVKGVKDSSLKYFGTSNAPIRKSKSSLRFNLNKNNLFGVGRF